MSEPRKQWEGQIVDGTFPLGKYLGGSDHSAVFLTDAGKEETQQLAIKLVPADAATVDQQLLTWEAASQLSHPNLLRLINAGRCVIDGNDLLYLVMEYAQEDLSQILPERALSLEETREVLGAALDALAYLHGKGFVHGGLKPANILASGEHLKLSSDAILKAGQAPVTARRTGAYDAPEVISGMLAPAADIWSLGTTLVEVMTQHLPEWQPGPRREPVVPARIAAPFSEIVRQCLRLEPERRASVADIGALLNSRAAAASASASLSTSTPVSAANPILLSGNISSAAAKPSTRPEMAARASTRMPSRPLRPQPYQETRTRSRFLVPLTLGALAFAAILTVPRLFRNRADTQSVPAVVSEKPSSQTVAPSSPPAAKTKIKTAPATSDTPKAAATASLQANSQNPQALASGSLKTTSEKVQPSPAVPEAPKTASAEAVKPAAAGVASAKGEVLDQVLPDVSQKARATIRGSVRVGVKVHVDPAGGVSEAELDSAGPSKFFADLALQAARKWAFTPPEVNGKSVASEWRLKFEFKQNGTKVMPAQIVP